MEGAALHYVCNDLQVPYIQLRTISNMVGERDKTRWKMKEALLGLNNTLIAYIDALANIHSFLNKAL